MKLKRALPEHDTNKFVSQFISDTPCYVAWTVAMESAPPLNLSTTIKVEDLKAMVPDEAAHEYTVEGELVPEESSTAAGQDEDSDDAIVPGEDQEAVQEEEEQQEDGGDGGQEAETTEDTKENLTNILTSNTRFYGRDKEYKCAECSLAFVRASQLRAHERTHFEEQVCLWPRTICWVVNYISYLRISSYYF